MIRLGASELLILASVIALFNSMNFAIVCLSLGVIGAIGRFGSEQAEKSANMALSENNADNLSTIITNFVENMNKNKENFH